jgi:hypothetical protein
MAQAEDRDGVIVNGNDTVSAGANSKIALGNGNDLVIAADDSTQDQPQRVVVSAQTSAGASAIPIRNSTLTLSAARTCGMVLHHPRSMGGRIGALGRPSMTSASRRNNAGCFPVAVNTGR